MELQGQEDAGARVVSEACIASVDSVVKWPELLEWLEWPDEFSICVARGLLYAWPGVFYWREDQGATEVAKMARLEGLVRYEDGEARVARVAGVARVARTASVAGVA